MHQASRPARPFSQWCVCSDHPQPPPDAACTLALFVLGRQRSAAFRRNALRRHRLTQTQLRVHTHIYIYIYIYISIYIPSDLGILHESVTHRDYVNMYMYGMMWC